MAQGRSTKFISMITSQVIIGGVAPLLMPWCIMNQTKSTNLESSDLL